MPNLLEIALNRSSHLPNTKGIFLSEIAFIAGRAPRYLPQFECHSGEWHLGEPTSGSGGLGI